MRELSYYFPIQDINLLLYNSKINYYLRICKLIIQAVYYGILKGMSQDQIITMNVYLLKKFGYFDGVKSDLLEKVAVKWTKIAMTLVTVTKKGNNVKKRKVEGK